MNTNAKILSRKSFGLEGITGKHYKEILYGVITAVVTALGGQWVVAIPADLAAAEEDVLENTRLTHNQLVAWN